MNPTDTLRFFETHINRLEHGAALARSNGNVQLLALNARQSFKAHLMCGLILWRQGEDPRKHMEGALKAVTDAKRTINSDSVQLPESKAMLVASLLGASYDFNLLDDESPDGALDRCLSVCAEQSDSTVAAAAIAAFKKQGLRTELLIQSYSAYFSIRKPEATPAERQGLVKHSEQLFKRRATDAYYRGGEQTEGGGPDNGLVVDYRLALVIKQAGMEPESEHSWRWS